jgi:intein/homing endonuclease
MTDLTKISEQLATLIELTKESNRLAYTSAELAEKLGVNEKKITEWRQAGAIRGIFKGKAYIYPADEVRRFLRDYLGKNLSNRAYTEASVALVRKGKLS